MAGSLICRHCFRAVWLLLFFQSKSVTKRRRRERGTFVCLEEKKQFTQTFKELWTKNIILTTYFILLICASCQTWENQNQYVQDHFHKLESTSCFQPVCRVKVMSGWVAVSTLSNFFWWCPKSVGPHIDLHLAYLNVARSAGLMPACGMIHHRRVSMFSWVHLYSAF